MKVTGLGTFLDGLQDALDQTTFIGFVPHYFGIFGEATASGTTIQVGSTDPAMIEEMILIHELVHVYDYIHRINLGGLLPPHLSFPYRRNRLYYAENMAYASAYFFDKFEQLSRLEANFAADKEADCEMQQKEFAGSFRIGPGYSIWVFGIEFKPTMADVVIASQQMGLDFSCETLLKCIKPHPCCKLTCPPDDTYSKVLNATGGKEISF